MSQRQAVLLVVAVAVVAVGLPVAGAQETTTETPIATNDTDENGLGTQLTAFLQSNSAAANDTVENGMWKAGFDRANESAKAALVTSRTGSLEQRLERLRAENETLRRQYENGTISEQAYVARQSRLSARIDSLQTAVNDTETAAEEVGVNDSRLRRLKRNASELTGPEVAEIARGLGGGSGAADREANRTGSERSVPPGKTGNGTAAEQPSDQGQTANTTDGQGQPADPANGPSENETSDAGNGGDDADSQTGGGDGGADTQGNDGGDGGSDTRGDGGADTQGSGDGGDGGSGSASGNGQDD